MKYKSSVDCGYSGKDADTLTRCPHFSLLIPPLALSDDAADDAEVKAILSHVCVWCMHDQLVYKRVRIHSLNNIFPFVMVRFFVVCCV